MTCDPGNVSHLLWPLTLIGLTGSSLSEWNIHFLSLPHFNCTKPVCQIHYPPLLMCVPISQNQPLVSNQMIWWKWCHLQCNPAKLQWDNGVQFFTEALVHEWFILASPSLLSGWLRVIFLKLRIPKEKLDCVEMHFQVVCVCLIEVFSMSCFLRGGFYMAGDQSTQPNTLPPHILRSLSSCAGFITCYFLF